MSAPLQPSDQNAPYDPLAALMAPPPRMAPSVAPSMADDPLAAMMAPPSRSVPSMRQSISSSNMTPNGPPPSKVNVWTPPPAATANTMSNFPMIPPENIPETNADSSAQASLPPPPSFNQY